MTSFFKEASESLAVAERLIKEIRVVPIRHHSLGENNHNNDLAFHTIWSYYYGLGDYERSANDTPSNN